MAYWAGRGLVCGGFFFISSLRAAWLTLGERSSSPSALYLALGEGILPRVPSLALGKLFLFFKFFCPIFFMSHSYIISNLLLKFGVSLNFFNISLISFVFSNFWAHFKIELQVKQII
jgi:hypothetical protein